MTITLPVDIWRHIAQQFDSKDLKAFRKVNCAFYSIALNLIFNRDSESAFQNILLRSWTYNPPFVKDRVDVNILLRHIRKPNLNSAYRLLGLLAISYIRDISLPKEMTECLPDQLIPLSGVRESVNLPIKDMLKVLTTEPGPRFAALLAKKVEQIYHSPNSIHIFAQDLHSIMVIYPLEQIRGILEPIVASKCVDPNTEEKKIKWTILHTFTHLELKDLTSNILEIVESIFKETNELNFYALKLVAPKLSPKQIDQIMRYILETIRNPFPIYHIKTLQGALKSVKALSCVMTQDQVLQFFESVVEKLRSFFFRELCDTLISVAPKLTIEQCDQILKDIKNKLLPKEIEEQDIVHHMTFIIHAELTPQPTSEQCVDMIENLVNNLKRDLCINWKIGEILKSISSRLTHEGIFHLIKTITKNIQDGYLTNKNSYITILFCLLSHSKITFTVEHLNIIYNVLVDNLWHPQAQDLLDILKPLLTHEQIETLHWIVVVNLNHAQFKVRYETVIGLNKIHTLFTSEQITDFLDLIIDRLKDPHSNHNLRAQAVKFLTSLTPSLESFQIDIIFNRLMREFLQSDVNLAIKEHAIEALLSVIKRLNTDQIAEVYEFFSENDDDEKTSLVVLAGLVPRLDFPEVIHVCDFFISKLNFLMDRQINALITLIPCFSEEQFSQIFDYAIMEYDKKLFYNDCAKPLVNALIPRLNFEQMNRLLDCFQKCLLDNIFNHSLMINSLLILAPRLTHDQILVVLKIALAIFPMENDLRVRNHDKKNAINLITYLLVTKKCTLDDLQNVGIGSTPEGIFVNSCALWVKQLEQ